MDTGWFKLITKFAISEQMVDFPEADSPVIPIRIRFCGLFIRRFINLGINSSFISIIAGLSFFLSSANACLNFV